MTQILVQILFVLLLSSSLTYGRRRCMYNGTSHEVGDRFDAMSSTLGLPDYEMSFLCTRHGVITIGCGLPIYVVSTREEKWGIFIPVGVKEHFGCLEYVCTDVGWAPTGEIIPQCDTEFAESTTSIDNGITSTTARTTT
ncbi:uncharacterized protein [Palaemon carinicauda]|uniref:uncharacterized protein n=1 Tax=Palaemon carinicauda TaxID=392227 RepID=UPI0035B5923E